MSEDYIVVSKMYLMKIDKSNEDYVCEQCNFQAQGSGRGRINKFWAKFRSGICIVICLKKGKRTTASGGEGEESVPLIRVKA